MSATRLREPARRNIIQRFVFVCEHPFFLSEERMLAQELFRRRFMHTHRLARNECPVPGNGRQTANRAIARLFGDCDFIRLEEVGSFWHIGGLRPVDVECRVTRLVIDPAHDWILHRVDQRHYHELTPEVRSVLSSLQNASRIAAQ